MQEFLSHYGIVGPPTQNIDSIVLLWKDNHKSSIFLYSLWFSYWYNFKIKL